MTDKYELLIVNSHDEVLDYLMWYPGLVDDCRVRLATEWRKIEGERVTRCFVAESVNVDECMALDFVQGSLDKGIRGLADAHPITLRSRQK